MATYINYGEGDNDATVQCAEWMMKILLQQPSGGEEAQSKFVEKFKAVHTDVEYSRHFDYGPVFDLFLDYGEPLFESVPELRAEERVKEVESYFAVVLSLLILLDDEDQLYGAATRLCSILAANAQQQPDLRLRLLMNLYNTFPAVVKFRYKIFKDIIDYANQANLFDQVLPYLEYLDAWMADWASYLDADEKRTLYLDLSKYLRALGKRVDSFQHLKTYHQLFQQSSGNFDDKIVKESTAQLLSDAVQIPSIIQFDDILSFNTVKAYGKTSEGAGLVELCRVFLEGNVDDLRKFHKKNEELFKTCEFSIEDSMSKIRLLTLATLAHNRSEMSLAEVAKAIEESEDNVERWVVRAISECVIDGRIDQLNHKVLVKSAFQRKFEKDEWAFLQNKLGSWIDNLENVIKFIVEQKAIKGAALDNAISAAA